MNECPTMLDCNIGCILEDWN